MTMYFKDYLCLFLFSLVFTPTLSLPYWSKIGREVKERLTK